MATIAENASSEFAGRSDLPSDSVDVIEHLPPGPADKLTALREAKNAAHASLRELTERRDHQFQIKFDADRWIANICRDHRLAPDADVPILLQQRERRDGANRELARMQPFADARSSVVAAIGGLLQNVENWLGQILRKVEITTYNGPAPKLGARAPARIVEQCRIDIARLRDDVRHVVAAPLPASEAKKLVRAEVAALAKSGCPDVSGMFSKNLFDGTQQIKWPTSSIEAHTFGGRSAPEFYGVVPDSIALLAWLNPEALCAKLDAELDRRSDDANAMTDETRMARLAELSATLLDVERLEEAAVLAGETDGLNIFRRRDADVRAVLGLASSLPAPEVL